MGKRQVNLTYRKAGTQPPVYVAGTFSEPAWQPFEMTCSKDANGEYMFEHTISAEPGTEIQYKFRLGTGNWWACDDTATKATDDQGNMNNILRIGRLSIDDGDFEEEEATADDDGPPVFSHECFEGHDYSPDASTPPDDESLNLDTSFRRPSRASRPSITAKPMFEDQTGDKEIDYDDPALEQFPYENRRSIIAQLQRIDTSTEPDRSVQSGIVPISPVSSPIGLVFSPASHDLELPERRSSAPRSSRGSLHSDHSHLSLASIDETIEEEGEDSRSAKSPHAAKNVLLGAYDPVDFEQISGSQRSAAPAVHRDEPETPIVRLEAPSSDEDEGISLSTGNSVKKPNLGNMRKRETRNPIERSTSAASVNPIPENGKQNNWIRSFFRVVVVDWIGHFFSNILFGNKRKAFFTLGTTVLCVGIFWKTASATRMTEVASPLLEQKQT